MDLYLTNRAQKRRTKVLSSCIHAGNIAAGIDQLFSTNMDPSGRGKVEKIYDILN